MRIVGEDSKHSSNKHTQPLQLNINHEIISKISFGQFIFTHASHSSHNHGRHAFNASYAQAHASHFSSFLIWEAWQEWEKWGHGRNGYITWDAFKMSIHPLPIYMYALILEFILRSPKSCGLVVINKGFAWKWSSPKCTMIKG